MAGLSCRVSPGLLTGHKHCTDTCGLSTAQCGRGATPADQLLLLRRGAAALYICCCLPAVFGPSSLFGAMALLTFGVLLGISSVFGVVVSALLQSSSQQAPRF